MEYLLRVHSVDLLLEYVLGGLLLKKLPVENLNFIGIQGKFSTEFSDKNLRDIF